MGSVFKVLFQIQKFSLLYLLICVCFCFFNLAGAVNTPDKAQSLQPAIRDIARKKTKAPRLKKGKSFSVPTVKIKRRQKRKKINLKDVRPPSTARAYYDQGTDEAELESLYNEEINHLFKILKKNKDSDLLLRLGSLYVEKARFITFKIQSDYDNKISEFEQGLRKVKPRLNLKPAAVYNKKAITLFNDFIQQYPRHARKDEVLFFLGFTSYQLGQEASGSKYFELLEKEFPKSIKLYEARFQMAEYYFSNTQWDKAYAYYLKVSRNKRGKFYFLSLYKMAWSAYKMSKTSRALKLLGRVISEGRKRDHEGSTFKGFTFVDEAISYMALFYSYSNRSPAQAPAYFYSLLGKQRALPELKNLAYNYRDTGHISGVIFLFTHLIERNPTHPEASEYKYQIVQSLYESSQLSQIFKHISQWIRDYGPGSLWAKANAIKKAGHLIEVTLREYALKNHQTFNHTQSNKPKQLALNFYKLYFTSFKQSQFSHEMRFFYAELLFDTGNYKSAAFNYEQLIRKFPSSKYARPAYLNQLLAIQKLLPSNEEVNQLTRGKIDSPVGFPESVGNFVSVSLRYLKKFPKQKNADTVLYRVASFYYNFNHFDKAALYFRQLFDAYPSSPHASNVGGILLDIYNKNKDYNALKELAEKFAKNKNTDKKLLEEAEYILQQLSFKQAQDLALKKQFFESARLYEKFARENPSSPLASLAFFNAGINYEKHKDIKKAILMYTSVLSYRDKKSLKFRLKASEFLPVLHEKLGFYRKAAQGYSNYAVNFPQDEKIVAYWYNAGVIYDAFNQVAKAVRAYDTYYRLNRQPERHEALYLTGLLYERNRNWKKAINYFNRYIKSPGGRGTLALQKVRASFKIAEIYQHRLRDSKKAKAWHQHTISFHKRLKAGTSYAARSHFLMARDVYDRFVAVRIPVQSKVQKRAVNQKIALLKQLEQELKPIIRYDEGEQIIASLALIGLANEKMAGTIYRAPLPKGLDKQGRIKYKEGIKQLITPYAQAAVKSYNLAMQKAVQLKVYSEWLEVASRGLHVVRLNDKGFIAFAKPPVAPEVMNFQVMDETGTASRSQLGRLKRSLKVNVSRNELERIAHILNKGTEQQMLQVISSVLNRDSKHLLAVSSLAYFYLKRNKPRVSQLIIHRVLDTHPNQPALINNLAVIALKNREVRQALVYLKQALSLDSRHLSARVNLGNIFLKIKDYENAHPLFKGAYNKALSEWGVRDTRVLKVLNNYGVALIGKKRWKPALAVFDKLLEKPSPAKEVIFNRAIVLAKGFKNKKFRQEAKGLVNELSFYSNSVKFAKKLNRLLAVIKE